MLHPRPIRMLTGCAASAALALTTAAAPAQANPTEHLRTVETHPMDQGQFRCGDLLLTVTGGTYTETIEATMSHGVIHVGIHRTYHGITLVGSDGLDYRATAYANERVVLLAADPENPVWVHEVNQTTFQGGAGGSPGYVHEDIRIDDGVETDVVSGRCDFVN
jgi:hypothetical protein